MTLRTLFTDALIAVRDKVIPVQGADGQFRGEAGYTVYGQYAGIYFAFLYSTRAENNPWFKDAETLQRAIAGWDFYQTQITADGKARICTFDQYWHDSLDEWGCYYWMNTLEMLRADLDAERIGRWEQSIDLIARAIGANLEKVFADDGTLKGLAGGSFANHTLWHVLCHYRFGMLRGDSAIRDQARQYMEEILRHVPDHGALLEHGQLVVKYAEVTLCAMSLFELFDGSAAGARAVDRGLEYVLATSYPDLSCNATVDIRNSYDGDRVSYTAPTFARSEVGRAYLTSWIRHFTTTANAKNRLGKNLQGLAVISDITRFLPEDAAADDGDFLAGLPERTRWEDRQTAITRRDGWIVTLCGDVAGPTSSRWCLERQDLLGVFHADAGLVVGGGHSIAQPEFSCFNIIAGGKLHYLHEECRLSEDGLGLSLRYGPRWCRIEVEMRGRDGLEIRYEVEDLMDVEAARVHLPLWGPGRAGESAARLVRPQSPLPWGNAHIEVSREMELLWPVYGFNPYLQAQKASTMPARGVLEARLDRANPRVVVTIRRGG